MEPFVRHTGLVAVLDKKNVDTDQIIPKQFLKGIERTGLGKYAFFDHRYLEDGETLNPDFELNKPRYKGASILLTRDNFGCGSSREHAVWALKDYGFRALLAPSFADIFHNNCFKNGVLPIVLDSAVIDDLFRRAEKPGYSLTIDLEACRITDEDGLDVSFSIDPFRRDMLLKGLDEIGLTLQLLDKIEAYEQRRPVWRAAGINVAR